LLDLQRCRRVPLDVLVHEGLAENTALDWRRH
jgi:hypothetical protein